MNAAMNAAVPAANDATCDSVTGYVLVGGRSTRMGEDKALLPSPAGALAQIVAGAVVQAVGSAVLIGAPSKYGHLGYRVVPDPRPHNGPLSGMEAALTDTESEWNLILACDLASTNPAFLVSLCREARSLPAEVDCLIPRDAGGKLQPLSAVYRRRCLGDFSRALDRGDRKLLNSVARLRARHLEIGQAELFQNVNTPAEWTQYLHDRFN